MAVTEAVGNSRWAEADRTGYITPGVMLTAVSKDKPHAANADGSDTFRPIHKLSFYVLAILSS